MPMGGRNHMFKGLMKIVAAFILLIGFCFASMLWVEYPIKSYCSDLDVGSSIEKALVLAKESGFVVPSFERDSVESTIIINNHMVPFFRIGCFIDSGNGKITSTKIQGTD